MLPDHPIIRNMEATGYPDGKGPTVACSCDICGEDIYEGDYYYSIGDEAWCEECINDCKETAEIPEPDYD